MRLFTRPRQALCRPRGLWGACRRSNETVIGSHYLTTILKAIRYFANRHQVDEGGGRILHDHWWVPLKIYKGKGARIILKGDLRIYSFQGDCDPVVITMGRGSTLHVDGDFMLAQGTKIILDPDAYLYIGGDDKEKGCGTTGDCKIMVKSRVHIGKDFLCSWNVFVTDCDWHRLNGKLGQDETYIGDHVWVTCNCSVLKGSRIGTGCVVSNGTVVHNQEFEPNNLIVGNPAQAVKKIGAWHR